METLGPTKFVTKSVRSTAHLFATLFLVLQFNALSAEDLSETDINEFSLEALMDIEVTSVSKKSQKLQDTAAAVFVITNEDIRRSGVTSIPEALRMAPGMNVNKIDSNKWAITSRGFNGRYANKLLVMIDGRSVYDTNFSGTYWENQDVLLEDIDRIEVIRGPGGTLWGANAVNGVINIITKHASETQGGYIEAGAGTEEKGFVGARYGSKLDDDAFARVYFKAFERDDSVQKSGEDNMDDWSMLRGGFRVDNQYDDKNSLTVQGDIYNGELSTHANTIYNTAPFERIIVDTGDTSGWNVLSRWTHNLESASEFTLQVYYDKFKRAEQLIHIDRDTLDIDFQHRFFIGQTHDVLWGASYRFTNDKIKNTNLLSYSDNSPSENLYGLFAQDEITLLQDRLWLTVGTKFQHSNLTTFGLQPSARVLWIPHQKHRLWASVSHAENTPSHTERYLNTFGALVPSPGPLPTVLSVSGQADFQPGKMRAWEIGYRVIPSSTVTIDTAIFYNSYSELTSLEPGQPTLKPTYVEVPSTFTNLAKANVWGAEIASSWQVKKDIQIDLTYSYLKKEFESLTGNSLVVDDIEPKHRASIRTAIDLTGKVQLNFWLRYTSAQKTDPKSLLIVEPPSNYLTLDTRLGWSPTKNISIELVGQNLLESQHHEYRTRNYILPSEIERSFYGQIGWKF